jgi:DNA repair protein RecO (recombination protein O)
MYLTVRGLVLRVNPYKDTDAILTLLTEDQGKLTVKARGLRRKNSPLIAPCQLLAYGEYTLFSYKGMYTVNEAHSIELFQGLHKDIVALSLGTYFAQVADVVSLEDAPNGEILSLILNCLYAIASTQKSHLLIKSVFELRCAALSGYEPDLSGCGHCGADTPQYLDISQGILECATCRDPNSKGIRYPVTESMLAAMRYICACHPKKLFAFHAGSETLLSLSQLTESYLCTQLERGFSALDFYKSLLTTTM